MRRIMFAAPKSGSGKTLLTCAYLEKLKLEGKRPAAFKCGPDFIDPLFHRKVIGVPSYNLDTYFTGETLTRQLLSDRGRNCDIAVMEGAMGLYDGLGGIQIEASSYELAKVTKTPIVLIVDAKGMGASLIALLLGFLSMDTEHLIKGVILNRTTKMFFEMICPQIEHKTGLLALGYYPQLDSSPFKSRHLGLILPDEIPELSNYLTRAATIFGESIKGKELYAIAESAKSYQVKCLPDISKESPVRIALALDETACFYYEDNIELLKRSGAEICPFSLLRDNDLPKDCDGLILGGGYPELHLKELRENTSMKYAIANAIRNGMPSLAECGGFMYLHDTIEDKAGIKYAMAGIIHGNCSMKKKLVRFGYAQFTWQENEATYQIKGHEFHYYDSTNNGTDAAAYKPVGNRHWECMHISDSHRWGFPHLYYYSSPDFVTSFIRNCREYRKTNTNK